MIDRVTAACALIVHKYYNDFYFKNTDFAMVLGLDPVRLNQIELEVATVLQFNFSVTPSDLEQVGDLVREYYQRLGAQGAAEKVRQVKLMLRTSLAMFMAEFTQAIQAGVQLEQRRMMQAETLAIVVRSMITEPSEQTSVSSP